MIGLSKKLCDTELTPHRHEHCKQDRTVIIEQQAHLQAQISRGEGKSDCQPSVGRAWAYLGIRAGVGQLPHFAPPVAQRAHDRVRVADLLSATQQRVQCRGGDTDTAGWRGRSHERRAVEEGQAVKEDYDPNDSGWDEEIRVPAQPQVVQGHLLPKVVPYMRRRAKITRSRAALHNTPPSSPLTRGQFVPLHVRA